MGKSASLAPPSAPSSTYRDDPDALSLHTTASDYQYDEVADLPSYSDSVANDVGPTTPSQPSMGSGSEEQVLDPYRSYLAPELRRGQQHQTPSAAIGQETSIRIDPQLMDADALEEYIMQYLRVVPPKQVCRVQGWHWESRRKDNGKTEKERIFDFDVVFDMKAHLPPARKLPYWEADVVQNADRALRGSFRRTRAHGARPQGAQAAAFEEHRPDLKDWCRDFCNDKAPLKIFRVSRTVYGLDVDLLRERIVARVRATHYRGHVDVSFPLAEKYVDIYSPHWINRARISWVRWIFYITFLWLLTWPILYFATRRWAVYNVSWYFSRWQHDPARGEDRTWKSYCSLTEEEWVEKHGNLIQSLVLERFQGDATEMPTDVDPRRRDRSQGAMPVQTGNRNVDAAVSFVQGGVDVWNAWNGRSGAAQGCGWGGDTC